MKRLMPIFMAYLAFLFYEKFTRVKPDELKQVLLLPGGIWTESYFIEYGKYLPLYSWLSSKLFSEGVEGFRMVLEKARLMFLTTNLKQKSNN